MKCFGVIGCQTGIENELSRAGGTNGAKYCDWHRSFRAWHGAGKAQHAIPACHSALQLPVTFDPDNSQ